MSKRQLAIGLLILMMVMGPVLAIASTGTYQIDRTEDDLFVTESGNVFQSTYYIILKDPNYRVTDYLLFRDLAIDRYARINNATLSVHTTSNQSIARQSVAYIRGILLTDPVLGTPGNFSEPPLTNAWVTWNVSDVHGQDVWHNVSVTALVRELVNRYPWATGQNLGFWIYSVDNVTRQFVSYDYGDPTLAPKLYVTYDVEPGPTDPDYPVWINATYGGGNSTITYQPGYRNYTFYEVNITSSGPKDMLISLNGDSTWYYYRLGSGINPVNITGGSPTANPTTYAVFRRILRTPDAIYAVVTSDQAVVNDRVILANSTDNGKTWNLGEIVNQWPGMNESINRDACIAQDSLGRLHVAWEARNGVGTQFLAHAIRHLNGSWTYNNVTHEPALDGINIFIDQNDVVHFAYSAKNASDWNFKQVYYQNQTGAVVGDQVRISTADDGNNLGASVVAYQNSTPVNRPYVGISWTKWQVGPPGNRWCYFRERTAFSWLAVEELNAGGTVNEQIALNIKYRSHLEGINDPPISYHVVWARWDAARYRIYMARRPVKETPPVFHQWVVTPTDQGYNYPSIMVDEAGDYFVAYSGLTDLDVYSNYYWDGNNSETGHQGPDLVNTTVSPSLALSSSSMVASLWYAVDPNGTVINQDDPCDSPECLQIIIDDIIGTDPLDPVPPGSGYEATGFFSRFAIRRYFLMIGWGMFWGPIWLFSYRRPSGYLLGAAFIFMLIGLGLLLQIPYI